jgi:hypothetical protein
MPDGRPGCTCIICHDYGDRDRLGTFLLRTIVHVTQFGWSVVLIPATDAGPGWAYTIGLGHSHGSPELAMFGGDIYEMEEVLGTLGRQGADGRLPSDGERREDVPRGWPVTFRAVDPRWHQAAFGGATAYYRSTPLTFLQVVWPDPKGLFPWDLGVDAAYLSAQPALWVEPKRHPEGTWTRRLAVDQP